MRKLVLSAATSFLMLMLAQPGLAHFGMVIPQTEILERPGEVAVDYRFWHPMGGSGMNLAKSQKAGVFLKSVFPLGPGILSLAGKKPWKGPTPPWRAWGLDGYGSASPISFRAVKRG